MTDSARILVVEDEPKIASALAEYLVAAGHHADVLHHGGKVLDRLEREPVDVVLLDVMLPGVDGLTLCRQIRERHDVGIVMVTARVEEIDRLLGLEFGADDYICKPFSLREVVARVQALLRRLQGGRQASSLPFEFDAKHMRIRNGDSEASLTRVECRLLARLCDQPGRIFSRAQLLDAIYDDHRVVGERTIDSHVRNLRRKLEDLGVEAIESVYGVGFRLVA